VTSSTDSGKDAAHIFLDLAQVFEYGDDAVNLTVQQLVESGSVTADLDEASGQLDLDLSRVVLGALAVIKPLLSVTATNWGLSEEETVAHLRRILDENL
jgi:hypothetical protein